MTEEELKKTVFGLLKKIAPDTFPETLKPGDKIREKLEIDSFDYLQFIVSLEENVGINVPEEDYGKVQELGELLNYIVSKTSH